MIELLIVGSGAAGAAAALTAAQRGIVSVMLDIGFRPPPAVEDAIHLHDQPAVDDAFMNELFGAELERLSTLVGPYVSPKLRPAPYRFVTEGTDALLPIRGAQVEITQSAAVGGLGNAWGAGCYAFTDDDLRGHAVGAATLQPWFREVAEEVGISGADDALGASIGRDLPLQPTHPLGRAATAVLDAVGRSPRRFAADGVTIGHARLAVLSRPHRGRPASDYKQTAFLRSTLGAIYSPRLTIDRLVAEQKLDHRGGLKVERFVEHADHVEVHARPITGGDLVTFKTRKLLIAAGALNSARLVLASNDDTATTVPLLDNELTLTPFIHLPSLGAVADRDVHGLAQLNYRAVVGTTADGVEDYVFGAMYGVSSIPAYEFLLDFPLGIRGAVSAARALLPAMFLVSTFYPSRPRPEARVGLADDGVLDVKIAPSASVGVVERRLIRLLRRAGLLGHTALMKRPLPGNGIHYAGTLPFSASPSRYETDVDGGLGGSQRVAVCDAAVFPSLPAKNHTFTMMANAMRITARFLERP